MPSQADLALPAGARSAIMTKSIAIESKVPHIAEMIIVTGEKSQSAKHLRRQVWVLSLHVDE